MVWPPNEKNPNKTAFAFTDYTVEVNHSSKVTLEGKFEATSAIPKRWYRS